MKSFIIFLVICSAIAVGLLSFIKHQASANTNLVSLAKTTLAPSPAIDTAALDTKLSGITAPYTDLDIGVSVIDLGNNQKYNYGESAAYVGASTTKVLTATLFLHDVEQGKFTLQTAVSNDTAANQLTAMIEQSDNDAWAALNDKIGLDFLQAYADGLGLDYNIDNNSLGTADMATLLQELYTGQLLNKADTALLLGHMQKSVRSYIGSSLDSGYTVYHKAGWLDDRLMDAAIVTKGSKKYILVIFSKAYSGSYDFTDGASLFTSITKAVDAAVL